MKKVITIISMVFLTVSVVAQAPQSFRYQAVARDNSGNVLANQNISFRISILSGSITGTVTYSETHTGLSTNTFGLVELEIGKGTPVTGSFSTIDWGTNSYFVKIEMDPEGGSAYQVLSTSQLLSVPYALHANTVQTGDNWGADAVQTDATLSGNGTVSTPLLIANNGVTSAKIQNGAVTSGKLATNSVTTDKINSGAVTGAKISQAGATTGQVLKWNGTTWSPALDETDGGLILPFSGTGTSGSPLFNIVNLGTSGAISTFSSGNYGIWGESSANMGIGVYGVNKTSSGKTFGVFGDVYSPSGYSGYFQGGKVFIQGNTGIGIQDPSAKLEVAGQVKITGGSPGTGKVLTSDGAGLASWQTPVSTWLKNGSNLYYNSGNIGVGLDNPEGMLEIFGNSVDYYPHLFLSETDGFARISFRTMIAPTKHWVLAGHTNGTDGNSQWHLNYNNGTIGKNMFSVYGDSRIAFDGNVGIGTTDPGTLLQVHSNATYVSGITPIIRISDNLKVWNIGLGSSGDRFSVASEDYTERLTILKSNGNVGIGTSSPAYKLTIYDANNSSLHFLNSGSGTGTGDGFIIQTLASGNPVWLWNYENSNMHFGTNNANRMIINSDGHVSMMSYLDLNTDGIYKALSVAGKQALWWDGTYFSWGYDAVWNYFADRISIGRAVDPGTSYMLYVQGTAYATGTWNSSDARFKKNILPISGALEKVLKVNGNSFEFRNDEFTDYHFSEGKQFGFIAQELEPVFPELVNTESDGYKSVNYNGMIPVLLEAIKEQQKLIDGIKAENDQLKKQNEQFNARLEQLEALKGYNADKQNEARTGVLLMTAPIFSNKH